MADSTILTSLSDALAELVERTGRSVVAVDGREGWPSSGIVIRPGVAVTAEESLDRDEDLALTLADGRRVPAVLAGRDPSTDIAVLRYEAGDAGAATAALPPPAAARAGGLAIAVGRFENATVSAAGTVGVLGPEWRSMQGGRIETLIRLDLRLSRVAEGGAVVDAAGGFVGMAVFGPRRRVLVIPAATIDRVTERILAGGSIRRAYLGASVQAVREPAKGLVVTGVDAGGPAEAAGILLGDVIESWNGEPLAGMRDLVGRLGPDSAGTVAALGIRRAGAAAEVAVTLAERPRA
jgi:S1-C subfamily serine protease